MIENYLTPAEIEKLGIAVNGLGVLGSQVVLRQRPDLLQAAHRNLQKLRQEEPDLLRRMDEMARKTSDESALRLIEDLDRLPTDAMPCIALARRCLLACAFLGHCIAISSHPPVQQQAQVADKTLH